MQEQDRSGIGIGASTGVGLAAAALALACGCGGGGGGGPKAPGAAGPIRLLSVHTEDIAFHELTPAGLKETRRVPVPSAVEAIEWSGPEPIVLLSGTRDEKRDGEIGRITERGYEPFPALPAETWKVSPAPEGFDHFEQPHWKLVVSPDGVIWQGRCEWGYFGDGDACTEWVYARVHPAAKGPATTMREEPRMAQVPYEVPPIAPGTSVQLAIADIKLPVEAGEDERTVRVLRCTQGGKTTEFPPEDQRDSSGVEGEVTWLSSDPPIYSIEYWYAGEGPMQDTQYFEGCATSETYASAVVQAGPAGVFAIVGTTASVRRGTQELGKLSDAAFVRFAPPPAPPAP